MTFDKSGEVDVRKQTIDAILKGFAKRLYKIKNYVNIVSSGAWRNDFFRASPDTLTAGTTRDVKGIARGAAFPQASTSFEKVRTDMVKYGLEESIQWEDIIAGEVNIRDQTIMRITEGVVYSVDRSIYSGLSSDSDIQSFTISSGYEWDVEASAAIIDDLEHAEELIGTYHYPTENLVVFVNLRNKRNIVNWLVSKGAQLPGKADEAARGGVIGKLDNKTFVVSDVVTASEALVMVPNRQTWKELVSLQSDVKTEPLKDVRIRAAEYGVLQVTDPKCIVKIENTQASA